MTNDFDEAAPQQTETYRRLAGRLIVEHASDDDLLKHLDARLTVDRMAFATTGHALPFIAEVFEVRPSLATRLCERVLSGDVRVIDEHLHLRHPGCRRHISWLSVGNTQTPGPLPNM